MRKLTKKQWIKRRRRRRMIRNIFLVAALLSLVILVRSILHSPFFIMSQLDEEDFNLDGIVLDHNTTIKEMYLTPNKYSRPGITLKEVTAIVIHYVGNPGTSAANNRSYFEGLKTKETTYASSHFIIGLEGEIIQCIPLNEVAYASNERNIDTISIEVCHEDETGEFNEKTYESLISLVTYLCDMFQLSSSDIIRHYDVTKKLCPLYYVEHEDAWIRLKEDVEIKLKERKEQEEKAKEEREKRK